MDPMLVIGLAIVLIAPIPLSLIVEALRKKPREPSRLDWDASIPISYATVAGSRIRYIRTGDGPPVVLLHTLRTQLDIFQTVIPELAKTFTVYAMDYPGHGWSDIPVTDYTPTFFVRSVTGFLDALHIENALMVGVSIGGTIPLLMAAGSNPRIRAVVSINPYDYPARGADRANAIAKLIFTLAAIPVLGETVMRLRNRAVEGKIMEGGVSRPNALPNQFLEELFTVGERPGHYRAFLNLIRHSRLWSEAHEVYGRVDVPVLLVYADDDWSRPAEQEETLAAIPHARREIVRNAGHFLPLDQPRAVTQFVTSFARELQLLPAPA